jgi:phage recombination protein Bet
MSTALAVVQDGFTQDQIELIKRQICVGGTDDELKLFLHTAKRRGLDPMTRQIYAIKRQGKMTIQTAIDGFRLIAGRTGQLAGISDVEYDSETERNPKKATVVVTKIVGGHLCTFTASARWSEYNVSDGPLWRKMPYLMLGKCAEALALRKAFPDDLSGLYTTEEMGQAENAPQRDDEAFQRGIEDAHLKGSQKSEVEKLRMIEAKAKTKRQLEASLEITDADIPIDPDAPSFDEDGNMIGDAFEAPPVDKTPKKISSSQVGRFWTICRNRKIPEAHVREALKQCGIETTKDITQGEMYDNLVAWAEGA